MKIDHKIIHYILNESDWDCYGYKIISEPVVNGDIITFECKIFYEGKSTFGIDIISVKLSEYLDISLWRNINLI